MATYVVLANFTDQGVNAEGMPLPRREQWARQG